MIGRTIGNYVVKSQIGQGGMGAVYLAEHPRIKRLVAIKVLLPEFGRDPTVVARFFNEAKAANEIHHENIIDIIDFGELPDDGSSYIIMEWLDGRSLSSVLDNEGKLPVPRAIHIAKGIGRALAAAHNHGIVHRDLKPDNIFLLARQDDPDFVKVLDFGIAKLMAQDVATEIKTQTGAIIGTPSFMAPEQCRGLPIDGRTDIYALGCILYRMLTGTLPFNAQALGELLLQHMMQVPTPLRQLEPGIPQQVEAAVLRAMEKDPNNRFQRIEQLLSALAGVATGAHPIHVTEAAMPSKTPTLGGVGPATVGTKLANKSPSMDTIGSAAGQAFEPTENGGARNNRRPILIAGGVAFCAAFGAVAFVMSHHGSPAPAPTPVAPSPPVAALAQPATPTPPPVMPTAAPVPVAAPTPAPAAPSASRVTIRTLPANAAITLDDAKMQNPFDGQFPRGALRHHLVVKAPGYRTESQWVIFDADHDLEVALQKGEGLHEGKEVVHARPKLPAAPATAAATTAPVAKPAAPVAAKPATEAPKPVEAAKPDDKKIYKGTKGKLITEFPE